MYIYTNVITFHFHQNYCKEKLKKTLKNKDSKIKLQFDESLLWLMQYKSKNIFMKFSLGRRKKDIRKKEIVMKNINIHFHSRGIRLSMHKRGRHSTLESMG